MRARCRARSRGRYVRLEVIPKLVSGDQAPHHRSDVLDAYIIEEIKKQEDERRRREGQARPRLHIEIPSADEEAPQEEEAPVGDDNAVIRIDI